MLERDSISNLRKLREAIDPELQHLIGDDFNYIDCAPEEVAFSVPEGPSVTNDVIFKRLEHSAFLEDILGLEPAMAIKAAHDAFPDPRPINTRVMSKTSTASRRRHVTAIVDELRKRSIFSKVAESDGWERLIDSGTNFVEQQIAALGT